MDNVLSIEQPNDLKDLGHQLKTLGFSDKLLGAVEYYIQYPQEKFMLIDKYRSENERTHYTLHFEKSGRGSYDLKRYDALLRICPPIPDKTISGININELNGLMKKYDWSLDQHSQDIMHERLQTKEGRKELGEIERIMNHIHRLHNNPQGKEVSEKMMFKYWMDTPYEPNVFSLDHLKEQHEFKCTVNVYGTVGLTKEQAYDFLKNTVATELLEKNELSQKSQSKINVTGSVISDEVLQKADTAMRNGNNWMAYNNSLYFIDKNDMQFFNNEKSASEFALDNNSDRDHFTVINVSSVQDLFAKIPNGILNLLNQFNSIKTNVMNEQNLDYLKGNIKLTGFGENFNDELEKNLKEGKDDFQLSYKNEINKKPFEATLNFRKSEKTDMYFFNSYHASLQKSNGEKVEQTFNLNKGKGVTAKEAFNLLDGRSVHKQLTNKDNVPYQAWLQLDFENKDKNNNFEVKQFHENYGYDLKAAVSKYAVAELNTPEKEKPLMESLQRGNVQSVTIDKGGSPEKMFIEANPQFKSVTLYDGHMKRVPKENVEQYHSKETKVEKKEDVKKKDNKQDITKDTKQKNSLLPKKQNTNGLLEKKRTSSKKGMAIG